MEGVAENWSLICRLMSLFPEINSISHSDQDNEVERNISSFTSKGIYCSYQGFKTLGDGRINLRVNWEAVRTIR